MNFAVIATALLLVPQVALAESLEQGILPFRGTAGWPVESELSFVADAEDFTVTITSPNTARPFWGMSEIRPPISTLWSAAPSISLVSEIGTPEERRLTVVPRNISQRKSGYTFTENLKIPLFVGEIEVGVATLFSMEGEVNTHKVLYRLDRKHFSKLGERFLILSGSPLAKLVTTKAEQAGAGQPATASESKPDGGQNPQPESEPAPR